jgi:hypothetical protein
VRGLILLMGGCFAKLDLVLPPDPQSFEGRRRHCYGACGRDTAGQGELVNPARRD